MKPGLLVPLLLTLCACGRTPEPRTAFPCTVDLTGDCQQLDKASKALVKQYLAEITSADPDDARADDIGACNGRVVDQELTLQCVADRCDALCGLHPCATRDPAQSCPEDCAAILEDAKLKQTSLDDGIRAAAEQPGLCTCDVCVGGAKKLCDQLWNCP